MKKSGNTPEEKAKVQEELSVPEEKNGNRAVNYMLQKEDRISLFDSNGGNGYSMPPEMCLSFYLIQSKIGIKAG